MTNTKGNRARYLTKLCGGYALFSRSIFVSLLLTCEEKQQHTLRMKLAVQQCIAAQDGKVYTCYVFQQLTGEHKKISGTGSASEERYFRI